MIARVQHGDERADGRHTRGESVAAYAAFQGRERGLQMVARGIAGAGVVPAAVRANAGELEGGREIKRDVDGARQRIGLLSGMNGEGRVSVVGHEVLLDAPVREE